jgi:hypothetical protein
MKEALENVPENRRVLARAIRRSLDHYEDEAFLSGKRSVATAMAASEGGFIEGGTAATLDLNKVDAKAIVHFYNGMFQAVITELEREVGAKAWDLVTRIIQGTRHHETFLTQFDLQGNTGNIALRIQEQISAKGSKPSERELVGTFQEVFRGLLFEKSKLLGPRAAEATVARLGEKMAATHPQFRPLVDHLAAFAGGEKA